MITHYRGENQGQDLTKEANLHGHATSDDYAYIKTVKYKLSDGGSEARTNRTLSAQTCPHCSQILPSTTSLHASATDLRNPSEATSGQSKPYPLDSAKPPDPKEAKERALDQAMKKHVPVCGQPFEGYTRRQRKVLADLKAEWRAAEGEEKPRWIRFEACLSKFKELFNRSCDEEQKDDCDWIFLDYNTSEAQWDRVLHWFQEHCEYWLSLQAKRRCEKCGMFVYLVE